jgi:hypothetical protein
MINIESTTVAKAKRNVINRKLLQNNITDYIRKAFDNAATSLEAESWITIAIEYGFKDLAAEMKTDLQNELVTD